MSQHLYRDSEMNVGMPQLNYDNGFKKEKRKVLLAVMGVTGVGRTSFIQVATGGNREEDKLESC
jgi:hypothetical protein